MKHERLSALIVGVANWAGDKGILSDSHPIIQLHKTVEEVGELFGAISKNQREQIMLEAGDVMVTLIIQMSMHGIDESHIKALAEALTDDNSPLAFIRNTSVIDIKTTILHGIGEATLMHDTGNRKGASTTLPALMLAVFGMCLRLDLDPLDCLEAALNKITKRTGKMMDGTFVKSDDLQTSH